MIALLVVVAVLLALICLAGVIFAGVDRRAAARLQHPAAQPDPDAPGTPGPPVGGS